MKGGSSVPDPQKSKIVQELHDKFSRMKTAVLSDYQGLSVKQINVLRKELREKSVEFYVVKNTLAKRASKETPLSILDAHFKGPTAVALSYDDPVTPVKVLTEFSKKEPKLKITVGFVEGREFDCDTLKELAKLPPREVLLSRMLSGFNGPSGKFVGTLNGVLVKFVGILNAIKEKKQG